MCQVSDVRCHMPVVRCHISHKKRQSSEASQWMFCYQWGLPRLVSFISDYYMLYFYPFGICSVPICLYDVLFLYVYCVFCLYLFIMCYVCWFFLISALFLTCCVFSSYLFIVLFCCYLFIVCSVPIFYGLSVYLFIICSFSTRLLWILFISL